MSSAKPLLSAMHKRTVVNGPDPMSHLCFTANEYVPESSVPNGLTLVMLHATSLHKETWEPVIHKLFAKSSYKGNLAKIRDVWSLEMPNHGESAVRNEEVLLKRYDNRWDGYEYPRLVKAFLDSNAHGIDFQKRRIIIVGHSVGGNTAMMLHGLKPAANVESFVLLDPTVDAASKEKDQMNRLLTIAAWTKQDVWIDCAAAHKYFLSHPVSARWDSRVLDLYIKYGLRIHSAAKYTDPFKFLGVTLCCSKSQESACYRADEHRPEAYKQFKECLAVKKIPLHLILSSGGDFGARAIQERQANLVPESEVGSVQWIAAKAHLFVQEQPELTADVIYDAMETIEKTFRKRSLL